MTKIRSYENGNADALNAHINHKVLIHKDGERIQSPNTDSTGTPSSAPEQQKRGGNKVSPTKGEDAKNTDS